MRVFSKNLFLFLVPLAVVFVLPCLVLFWSGEFYSVNTLEHLLLQPKTILVGDAYSNFSSQLRLDAVALRRPEVITMGNSHVGEFRSLFFKEPSIFYNTTGAAVALSDYVHLLEQLRDTPPKIILANMEYNMFNPDNAKNNPVIRPDPYPLRSSVYDPFFESLFRNGGWWKVYADYFSHKFTLAEVSAVPNAAVIPIGLRAHVDDAGVTNDGSDYAGDIIHNTTNQQEIIPSINAFAANLPTDFNLYGNTISRDALAELRTFLALAKERGIVVIGFSPPIAHPIYLKLKEQNAYAFTHLTPTLTALYKEYGFDFYDFSDITAFGSSDSEMVEIQHGGEKMYLRMFMVMAAHTPALGQLVDLPALKERLANATSTYYVFGIEGD